MAIVVDNVDVVVVVVVVAARCLCEVVLCIPLSGPTLSLARRQMQHGATMVSTECYIPNNRVQNGSEILIGPHSLIVLMVPFVSAKPNINKAAFLKQPQKLSTTTTLLLLFPLSPRVRVCVCGWVKMWWGACVWVWVSVLRFLHFYTISDE